MGDAATGRLRCSMLQWAIALHKVDPALQLGGPCFKGSIVIFRSGRIRRAGPHGRTLYRLPEAHNRLKDLAFFCSSTCSTLRGPRAALRHPNWSPTLLTFERRRRVSECSVADYRAQYGLNTGSCSLTPSVLVARGLCRAFSLPAARDYYFHYLPMGLCNGCGNSPGTVGMFTVDSNYQIKRTPPNTCQSVDHARMGTTGEWHA